MTYSSTLEINMILVRFLPQNDPRFGTFLVSNGHTTFDKRGSWDRLRPFESRRAPKANFKFIFEQLLSHVGSLGVSLGSFCVIFNSFLYIFPISNQPTNQPNQPQPTNKPTNQPNSQTNNQPTDPTGQMIRPSGMREAIK